MLDSREHERAERWGRVFARLTLSELQKALALARKLRDESYESREEFRADLNTLVDKLSLITKEPS